MSYTLLRSATTFPSLSYATVSKLFFVAISRRISMDFSRASSFSNSLRYSSSASLSRFSLSAFTASASIYFFLSSAVFFSPYCVTLALVTVYKLFAASDNDIDFAFSAVSSPPIPSTDLNFAPSKLENSPAACFIASRRSSRFSLRPLAC